MKLNNHNTMFHHENQLNMYALGSILILIAHESWKNVHLTNHIVITLMIHSILYQYFMIINIISYYFKLVHTF
jgi:hypothetical protein